MYSLSDYIRMVSDEVRMRAYAGALADVVRPGSVVVDLGAGTGVMGLMACKLGARRVFAIETADVLPVAEELARENGVSDRIEFFPADSRTVALPELADVIVSDLRGSLSIAGENLDVIADARRRFLSPGGTLVPERDVLWAGVVDCPELYRVHLGPETAPHGVTLDAARARQRNRPCSCWYAASPHELLVPPAPWATIAFSSVESEPVSGTLAWEVSRDGNAHGVVLWFETFLRPGWTFSSAPGTKTVYPQTFLPFERPVAVSPSDRIDLALWTGPRGEPLSWNTTIRSAGGREKLRSRQSTFLASLARPFSAERSRRAAWPEV
jgi:type I protein arginine methyltransferase